MKKDIKFVYFDVGGVLFRWREVLIEIAVKHKKPVDEVFRVYTKYDEVACRGIISYQKLWENMYSDLGISSEKDFNFFDFSMEKFTPILESHKFIKKIAKHLPVGLLTNIHHGVYDHLREAGNIPDINYATVVQSCLLGKVKPEKEIYHHAQKKAKVKPKNILFIDDFAINVEAAQALGWNTVLFDTDNPARSIREIRKWIKDS